jgi:Mg/Co/Ni transporter MgtE
MNTSASTIQIDSAPIELKLKMSMEEIAELVRKARERDEQIRQSLYVTDPSGQLQTPQLPEKT